LDSTTHAGWRQIQPARRGSHSALIGSDHERLQQIKPPRCDRSRRICPQLIVPTSGPIRGDRPGSRGDQALCRKLDDVVNVYSLAGPQWRGAAGQVAA
jgi:hypothetical protein